MSQDRPRVPQATKVKPPSMQNNRFGYQKCQNPLATMPRICKPRAMSNGRGPAAADVAHKIHSCLSIYTKSLPMMIQATHWVHHRFQNTPDARVTGHANAGNKANRKRNTRKQVVFVVAFGAQPWRIRVCHGKGAGKHSHPQQYRIATPQPWNTERMCRK